MQHNALLISQNFIITKSGCYTESDLSRENAGHLRLYLPEMKDSSYNITPVSGSDSKGDQEVFMVGQGDAPGIQTEEEIA
jgi:hypothetical protein